MCAKNYDERETAFGGLEMQTQQSKRKNRKRSGWTGCLILFVMTIASVRAASGLTGQPSIKPIVLAYVFPQNDLLQPGAISAKKLTRINYAFANLRDGRIVNGFDSDERNFAVLNALKQQNPSLTVLVSIGGWTWSGNFSDMALTAQSRKVFVQSAVDYLLRYHLDGLDIDWEYPGMTGDGHRFRAEDKKNFTLLLKDLRQAFDLAGRSQHRHLLLTIAAGASSEYLANTEMAQVERYVDTINLMAYDYYEPSSDRIAAHHAPLFTNPSDPKKISADRSVQEFLRAGVPASKLVLGVPFYGHIWGQVAPGGEHGLFQPGVPVPNAFAGYGVVSGDMLNKGFVRYWDPVASAPYLYNATTRTFVSYEDPESLARKCRYVLDRGLAGVMFWDYASDPTGKLLDTMDRSLHLDTSQ
jgi:chitinase